MFTRFMSLQSTALRRLIVTPIAWIINHIDIMDHSFMPLHITRMLSFIVTSFNRAWIINHVDNMDISFMSLQITTILCFMNTFLQSTTIYNNTALPTLAY